MGSLICEIVTPASLLFSEEVHFVSVPAAEGEIGVLARRAPFMSTINRGVVRVKREENSEVIAFAVSGGYVETDGDKVVVLASRAEEVGTLGLESVREQKAENEKKLATLPAEDPRGAFYRDELAWYTLLETQLTSPR